MDGDLEINDNANSYNRTNEGHHCSYCVAMATDALVDASCIKQPVCSKKVSNLPIASTL